MNKKGPSIELVPPYKKQYSVEFLYNISKTVIFFFLFLSCKMGITIFVSSDCFEMYWKEKVQKERNTQKEIKSSSNLI